MAGGGGGCSLLGISWRNLTGISGGLGAFSTDFPECPDDPGLEKSNLKIGTGSGDDDFGECGEYFPEKRLRRADISDRRGVV